MRILTFIFGLLATASANAVMPISVPTVDAWGLVGLAALLTIAGVIAVKRRK